MMRVLVAYASEHGSTRGIAERLGSVLADRGLQVDVRSIGSVDYRGSVDGPEGYDAFVLGSAVHDQHWLPAAHRRASSVLRRDRGRSPRP